MPSSTSADGVCPLDVQIQIFFFFHLVHDDLKVDLGNLCTSGYGAFHFLAFSVNQSVHKNCVNMRMHAGRCYWKFGLYTA